VFFADLMYNDMKSPAECVPITMCLCVVWIGNWLQFIWPFLFEVLSDACSLQSDILSAPFIKCPAGVCMFVVH
jgi:hypothetical protein